ncbi:hypothetical protein KF913_26955, partial [Candidatus Obscuribacterales bacterium]|nr:hypothetical protein [Candidatus Obscuribacterales bacterium]
MTKVSQAKIQNKIVSQPTLKTQEIVVIKIGGSTLTSEQAMMSLVNEVAVISETGAKVVLVHGGGPAISKAIAETGDKPHFIEGLRVTDDNVLAIAQKVLDELNETLVAKLNNLGINATAINSKTQGM